MIDMDIQNNIARFETELAKVQRPGMDKLLEYIRKSDFYTAPASTKHHLAAPGGLLQHSLNVLDAMRGLLAFNSVTGTWEYHAAFKIVTTIPDDSVIMMALLHDICKTHFYGTSTRNQKNDATGKWEKVPYYTVEDKMPLGHGPKSAMIVKQYMELTTPEMYAIWWHMGFNGNYENDTAAGASFEKYPLALALYTADMMASRLMEGEKQNKALFAEPSPATAGEFGEDPGTGEPDAPPPAMPLSSLRIPTVTGRLSRRSRKERNHMKTDIETLRALATATSSMKYNPYIDPDEAALYEDLLVKLRDRLSAELETDK